MAIKFKTNDGAEIIYDTVEEAVEFMNEMDGAREITDFETFVGLTDNNENSKQINVGDTIECSVDNRFCITLGKSYRVHEISAEGKELLIKDNDGDMAAYPKDDFIKVESSSSKFIKPEELEVGDKFIFSDFDVDDLFGCFEFTVGKVYEVVESTLFDKEIKDDNGSSLADFNFNRFEGVKLADKSHSIEKVHEENSKLADEEFVVGDVMVITANTNASRNEVGDIGVIEEGEWNESSSVKVTVPERTGLHGNYTRPADMRKATEAEIAEYKVAKQLGIIARIDESAVSKTEVPGKHVSCGYVVTEDYHPFSKGDVVKLVEDEGDNIPVFEDKNGTAYVSMHFVRLLPNQEIETKLTLEDFYEGDIVYAKESIVDYTGDTFKAGYYGRVHDIDTLEGRIAVRYNEYDFFVYINESNLGKIDLYAKQNEN